MSLAHLIGLATPQESADWVAKCSTSQVYLELAIASPEISSLVAKCVCLINPMSYISKEKKYTHNLISLCVCVWIDDNDDDDDYNDNNNNSNNNNYDDYDNDDGQIGR